MEVREREEGLVALLDKLSDEELAVVLALVRLLSDRGLPAEQ